MKKLIKQKTFEAEAIYLGKKIALKKNGHCLSLSEPSTQKMIRRRIIPFYVKKIVVSSDEHYFFLLLGLFQESFTVYALPSLRALSLSRPSPSGEAHINDAIFGPKGQYLYLLITFINQNESSTYLIQYDLVSKERKEIRLNHEYTTLFYSSLIHAFALYDTQGNIAFFNTDHLLAQTHLRPSQEVYLVEKGELLLLDSDVGFDLYSKAGKLLQSCTLFLEKKTDQENPLSEHHHLMTYGNRSNLLFYVGKDEKETLFTLYVFDFSDFRLLTMLPLKRKPFSLEVRENHLYLKYQGSIDLYEIREQGSLKQTQDPDSVGNTL